MLGLLAGLPAVPCAAGTGALSNSRMPSCITTTSSKPARGTQGPGQLTHQEPPGRCVAAPLLPSMLTARPVTDRGAEPGVLRRRRTRPRGVAVASRITCADCATGAGAAGALSVARAGEVQASTPASRQRANRRTPGMVAAQRGVIRKAQEALEPINSCETRAPLGLVHALKERPRAP